MCSWCRLAKYNTLCNILMYHTGNIGVMLTTRNYQPGNYTVTFNFTDIYGQTASIPICLSLAGTLIRSLL